MRPQAHMLTWALIGQVTPTPTIAIAGTLLSHQVIDAFPQTGGKIFWPHHGPKFGLDTIEAGTEFIAGALTVGWVIGHCPTAHLLSVAIGVLGGLVPDFVGLPLRMVWKVSPLHIPGLHWTVRAREAV